MRWPQRERLKDMLAMCVLLPSPGDLAFNCLSQKNLLLFQRELLPFRWRCPWLSAAVCETTSWGDSNKRKKIEWQIWLVKCTFGWLESWWWCLQSPLGASVLSIFECNQKVQFSSGRLWARKRNKRYLVQLPQRHWWYHYSGEWGAVPCCSLTSSLFTAAFMSLYETEKWLKAHGTGLCLFFS